MADENHEEEVTLEEEEPAKKKGKLMFFLLIIVVIFGLGAGATYYFYGHKIMKMLPGRSASPEQAGKDKEKAADKEKDKGKGKEKKHGEAHILALEPFIFNVSGNPSKFAKVSIGIEVKNAKIGEETKKIMPALRDKVLLVLGTKPAEAFLDVAQREVIKAELREKLGVLFKESSELSAVYITDIIIQ